MSEKVLSPSPLAPVKLSERPLCLAAQVAEDCLNFRKSGSNPPQIRRYGSFAGCTAAAEAGGKKLIVCWLRIETDKFQFIEFPLSQQCKKPQARQDLRFRFVSGCSPRIGCRHEVM